MTGSPSQRAAVVVSPGELAIMSVPPPIRDAAGVLVRPRLVGLCGTDLEILRGARPDAARILGHEGIADVLAAASTGDGVRPGDRVVFRPVADRSQDEILGHSYDGLFQDLFLVEAKRDPRSQLVLCPPELPQLCGPLVEPLATAVYGNQLVREIVRPERIIVVGAGPIGLLNLVAARASGARHVLLVNDTSQRLHWAADQHLVSVDDVLLNDADLPRQVRDRVGREGVDAIFLCTSRHSASSALLRVIECLRDGGCVDLVVGFSANAPASATLGVDLVAVRRRNVNGLPIRGHFIRPRAVRPDVWLTGHRGASRDHMLSAMALLVASPSAFTRLITHQIPLERLPAAIRQLLGTGSEMVLQEPVIKVVVDLERARGAADDN